MRQGRVLLSMWLGLALSASLLSPGMAGAAEEGAGAAGADQQVTVEASPGESRLPLGDPDSTELVASTPAAPEVDPNEPELREQERRRQARSGPDPEVEEGGAQALSSFGAASTEPPYPNPYRAGYYVYYLTIKPNYRYTGEQRLTVWNYSHVAWDADLDDGNDEVYYLRYDLFRNGVRYAVPGPVTYLPRDVPSGASVEVYGVVQQLPPGDYSIVWQMVRSVGGSQHRFTEFGDAAAEPWSFTISHSNAVAEVRSSGGGDTFTSPPAALYGQVWADKTLPVAVQKRVCEVAGPCWSSGWLDVQFEAEAFAAPTRWAPPAGALTRGKNYEWRIQVREGSYVSEESPPHRFTILGESTPAALPTGSTYGPGTTGPGAVGVGTGSASSPRGQVQGQRGDPVNTATGAFSTTVTDLRAEGPGVPLWVTRSYTSADQSAGPFGPGWTWSYGMRMWQVTGGEVTVRGGDGQQVKYRPRGDGTYESQAGFRSALTKTSTGWLLRSMPSGERYEFDSTGLLRGYENRAGLGVALTYTSGRLSRVSYPGGRRVSFTWGSGATEGRITRAAFVDGRAVLYGYTGSVLTSVTDPRGKETLYGYDSPGTGLLKSMTDPNGHRQYDNVYDAATRRVTSQTDARGKVTSFGWNSATEEATTTYPRGGVVTDTYVGNVLTATRDANGYTTRFGYDAELNRRYVTDRRGHTTFFEYDAAGNLTKQTDPTGDVRTWTYNGSGQVLTHINARQDDTGARSFTTVHTYDPVTGNLASTRTPAGRTTTRSYFPNGLLKSETSPRGNASGASAATKASFTTTYAYDATTLDLGAVATGSGRVTTYGYDTMGRRTSVTSPHGNDESCQCPLLFTAKTSYNAIDHVLTHDDHRTRAQGKALTFQYDDAGNLVARTDPTDAVEQYAFNEVNKPTTVIDGDGRTVSTTSYDDDGNVSSVKHGS